MTAPRKKKRPSPRRKLLGEFVASMMRRLNHRDKQERARIEQLLRQAAHELAHLQDYTKRSKEGR